MTEEEESLEKVLGHIASELNFTFPKLHAYVSKSGELPQLIIKKIDKKHTQESRHAETKYTMR